MTQVNTSHDGGNLFGPEIRVLCDVKVVGSVFLF